MHLMLLDGNNLLHRAFHAMPRLTRTSDGHPIGAIAGLCNTFLWFRKNIDKDVDTHCAIAFDHKDGAFRHKEFAEYKGTRKPPDPDLIPQHDLARKAAKAFGLTVLEMAGWEADDIIATLATKFADKYPDGIVTIYTSDKDMMQLVSSQIAIYDPVKRVYVKRKQVIEKFGVKPRLVPHVQALIGDSTDNIPGCPGVGPAKAVPLIQEFGSIKGLYANIDKVTAKAVKANLVKHRADVMLSLKLARLSKDVDVGVAFKDLRLKPHDKRAMLKFCDLAELTTIRKSIDLLK